MGSTPTIPGIAEAAWRVRAARSRLVRGPALAVAAAACALILFLWDRQLTHDVVWQLWLARQMDAGAVLYADLVEVNPPLWFWMGQGVRRVAGLLAIAPAQALVALVGLGIGVATLALARCLPERMDKRIVLPAAFTAMGLLPLTEFGQREQLTLIGVVPYIALIAARSEGRRISPGLALLIGALAAPALCLKPHFLLAPALLEAWLAWRLRGGWGPLRLETLILGGFGLAYFAAILAFAPDFITRILPFVRATYWVFDGGWMALFGNATLLVWVLTALAFHRLSRNGGGLTPLATAFLIAGSAFVLVYFVQAKGWQYHSLPATGCLVLAVAAQVAATARPLKSLRANPFAALVLAAPLLFGLASGTYGNPREARMAGPLAGMRPGEAVAVMTEDTRLGWPAVENAGLRWSSRYYALWMVPAFAEAERHRPPPPAIRAIADEVRAATLADLQCNAPHRILFDRAPENRRLRALGFDIKAFLLADPGFRTWLGQYRFTGVSAGFEIYDRTHRPATPAGCAGLRRE